jgi:hypothetical protein
MTVTVALGITTGAWGVDQLLTGKKLLVKSKNGREKIVLISKDPSIISPAAIGPDPKMAFHPNHPNPPWYPEDFPQTWEPTGNGMGWVYKDPTAPTTGPCKVGIIKAGTLLKFVCKDTIAPLPFTSANVAIQVDTDAGVRYCLQFGGTIKANTNEKYLAKDAPAPASCPPVQSPSGAFLDSIASF